MAESKSIDQRQELVKSCNESGKSKAALSPANSLNHHQFLFITMCPEFSCSSPDLIITRESTKKLKLLVFSLTFIFLSTNAVANISKKIQTQTREKIAKFEAAADGSIGVFAINTENNHVIAYHAKKRFPLCSTNKVMSVAAILKESEKHTGLLH